ncbi:MAG: histidine--tRNA ligase [Gammaproteobacteria bacterium]|jgi:histidyl-tRNA synthetase
MANNLAEEHLSVKGMPDILPEETVWWIYIEKILLNLMCQYGYQQIRLPLLEKTALFKRAVGETTDIVEKEMFNFFDEKNRSLSLRPEGTAGCVRSCIEHGLLRNVPQRLWYLGPMFRYEAPQKGRYRQFNQLGVECFGAVGWEIEVEQIAMFSRLWRLLGLEQAVQLEINNLGTADVRKNYTKDLVTYFTKHQSQLDLDSQRRLHTNPLRILDSKNPEMRTIIHGAPKLYDYLDQESLTSYQECKQQLLLLGINFIENPNIVRGLDYYTGMVWVWTSQSLGAQSDIGGGGRYDGLVEQLGGNPISSVGLAIGIERVMILLKQHNSTLNIANNLDGYLICVGPKALSQKFVIAEKIRDICPNFSFAVDLLGGNFKNQFKRADKSGAKVALILGEDEINTNSITVKYLRENLINEVDQKQQTTMRVEDLVNVLVAN